MSETGVIAAKLTSTNKISFWLSKRRILEAVLLSCVILVIWGLFSVPTILYILKPLPVSSIYEPLLHMKYNFHLYSAAEHSHQQLKFMCRYRDS